MTRMQVIRKRSRIWITATAIAATTLAVRATGALQPWELSSTDTFFRLRLSEPTDNRIVIVGIREEDLRKHGWPISDRILAELLQKIQAHNPRAIGLDLYRDVTVGEGHAELVRVYQTMPNLIGIEQLPDRPEVEGVKPPPELAKLNQIGFNNVVYDPDRKVRRSLLYWFDKSKQKHRSFALQLALQYLKPYGIEEKGAERDRRLLQLGQTVFDRFDGFQGVYVGADKGGYQIISNYRGNAGHFQMIPMQQILDGTASESLLHDRIVLIGSVATSIKDFSATPYSASAQNAPKLVAGVELQANFISEILSATLNDRTLLKSWPEFVRWAWVWVWAFVGAGLGWRLHSPQRTAFGVAVTGAGLTMICYGLFCFGWIVPFVPAAIALFSSAGMVIAAIAHSEAELKRSKEFLHRIINSIPDPVFVKDKHHRRIVLNEAYSKFLGRSIEELLERSDYEIFPQHQADVFRQQDELVFKYELELEHEGEFTNANGITYHIATKRSLHKDAAGNLFLVGVIRDITHRKTIEDELRRTTAELRQSNEELRSSQDRLSYLAMHDALTGLPNRSYLYDRSRQYLDVASRNSQIVGLLFLDLDGFKYINDTMGHGMGDLLLQAVAKRLKNCTRTSDIVARLGGDEFVVLLPLIPEAQDVVRVAEKILNTLSQAFAISGQTLHVTTSIGISLFPNDASTLEDLMQQADTAMYEAKKMGKNCFVFAQSRFSHCPIERSQGA